MHTIAQHTYGCNNGHAAPAAIPQGPAVLPEAAISLNGYIHVTGLTERIQVTARGHDAAEAAQRLKAGMDAVQATFAPAPPPTREARLAQLLTCGLQRAVAKGDMGLVERLSKAAALVLSGAVEPTDSPTVMAVRSQTEPETWYEVSGTICTCPDSQKHLRNGEKYLCKHALSILIAQRLQTESVA